MKMKVVLQFSAFVLVAGDAIFFFQVAVDSHKQRLWSGKRRVSTMSTKLFRYLLTRLQMF